MRTVARGGCLALLLALSSCGGSAPAPETPTPETAAKKNAEKKLSRLAQARAALKKGDWARAQTHLQEASDKDKNEAKLLLADLFLFTGRYEEVDALLKKGERPDGDIIIARALRRRGRLAEAQQLLKGEHPQATFVDNLARLLLLGDLLLEEGKKKKAGVPLFAIIEQANQGKLDNLKEKERAQAWGYVGRAAHLLRSPADANEAFNESESLAAADLELLLARGEAFLEKFDFGLTAEVLADAQKLAPKHPDVFLLEANLALKSSLAFSEAERLAKEVLKTNPKSSGARFLLAGVALRDLNIKGADEHIAAGLETNPRDLRLLSMKAAVRFLAEDPAGFDQVVDQVLELSPGYSELFRVVGEYAEWEHRYPDIEKLMRRAVRLDREDGRARSLLGLTLVRSGSDAAGVVELKRAFDLDPYNVRVLNTLDLYENIIPRDYVESRKGPFRFRFPKNEAELLDRYVPALLEDAHAVMVERYDYIPQAPIGIEIYEAREQFAVRTSGLPQTAIAGVCFGRKLATMSPIGSPGNLGMTLWHELAHVFHIGLSKNRVPRWLTEGLAEWETAVRDVGWSREMDLELHRALNADQLPSLGSMSRAFTHARRMQDVANAYYASGQIAEWIVAEHGEDMAQKLVAEFGKKKLPPDVVPPLLGAAFEDLDKQFRAHVRKDLARFDKQFVSEELLLDEAEIAARLKKNRSDRKLLHQRALLKLADGKVKQAETMLRALMKSEDEPQAAFSLARLLLATDKKKEGRSLLDGMIEKGADGYEVRMVLGRLDLSSGSAQEAIPHLEAAAQFDPWAVEPLSMLAAIFHKEKETEKELDVVGRWAKLAEHDAVVHRRLVELHIELGNFDDAVSAGKLAIWADLAGFETHRLYGQALARAGNLKAAEFEFNSALLCPARPTDILKLSKTWSEELERLGQKARAAKVRERIAKKAKVVPPN